jgi:hypothetical protein
MRYCYQGEAGYQEVAVTPGGRDADLGWSAPTVGMSVGEADPCSERRGQ